jgi:hypothetical protein
VANNTLRADDVFAVNAYVDYDAPDLTQGACDAVDITTAQAPVVAGVQVDDRVTISPSVDLPASLLVQPVTQNAAGHLKFRLCNVGAPVDAPLVRFHFGITR